MEAAESLFECLEQVADPGSARGVRHPFQGILRLTLLALRQARGTARMRSCKGCWSDGWPGLLRIRK